MFVVVRRSGDVDVVVVGVESVVDVVVVVGVVVDVVVVAEKVIQINYEHDTRIESQSSEIAYSVNTHLDTAAYHDFKDICTYQFCLSHHAYV